jgi:hypothetical protein
VGVSAGARGKFRNLRPETFVSGDSLVAEFSFTTKVQLASWDPGASRPAVTVIQPGPTEAALVLG